MESTSKTSRIKAAQKQSIIDSLSRGVTRAAACRAANVARRTLYNWLEDPAFREAVELAEQEAIEQAEGYVYQCAQKALSDPRYLRALFFLVKCKAGWNDRPPAIRRAAYPSEIPASVGAQHAAPDSSAHPYSDQPAVAPAVAPALLPPVGAQRAAPGSSAHLDPDQPALTPAHPKNLGKGVQSVPKPERTRHAVPSSPAPALTTVPLTALKTAIENRLVHTTVQATPPLLRQSVAFR